MEVIKDIAAIVGCILSVVSLVALCTKNGRGLIARLFHKHSKELRDENKKQTQDIEEIKRHLSTLLKKTEALEEVSKQQCRDTIKTIYYKYVDKQSIPLYERKTADKTYLIYHDRFDCNSYASLLYNEIVKWRVEPSRVDDDDDDYKNYK